MQPSDTSGGNEAVLSDDDLVVAYEQTSGTPGDASADALLAEIRRRGLDV